MNSMRPVFLSICSPYIKAAASGNICTINPGLLGFILVYVCMCTMDDRRIRCLWMLLAMVSEQTLHKTQVNALCICTYFAMLHVHNIKQPLSYYTSQDITLCVCEPGYITEFVRSVLHMREQTIIVIPSPQEIAWDEASPPSTLRSYAPFG